jgi:hypothetical protein
MMSGGNSQFSDPVMDSAVLATSVADLSRQLDQQSISSQMDFSSTTNSSSTPRAQHQWVSYTPCFSSSESSLTSPQYMSPPQACSGNSTPAKDATNAVSLRTMLDALVIQQQEQQLQPSSTDPVISPQPTGDDCSDDARCVRDRQQARLMRAQTWTLSMGMDSCICENRVRRLSMPLTRSTPTQTYVLKRPRMRRSGRKRD